MHMIRNTSLFLLIPLLAAITVLLPVRPALAEDGKAVTITIPPKGWEPFIIASPARQGQDGILLEVFRTAATAVGYQCRIEQNEERSGLLQVRQGRMDAAPKAQEWVAGPERYSWTDPICQSTDVVISRKDKPINYSTPEDLRGHTVGLVEGFKYPELAELIDNKGFTAVRATTVEDLLLMVMRGKLECAVVNPTVAKWVIRNRGDITRQDLSFSPKTVDNTPVRFAFTGGGKWTDFIAGFDKELAAMKKDGRLAAILNHYQ